MDRPSVRPQLEGLEERTLLSNTYTVNLATDFSNTAVANGQGSTGQFSGDLRWCVYQADQPVNAGSTIVFDTARLGTNTITLSFGELEISQGTAANPTMIEGPTTPSLTISGGNVPGNYNIGSRVFNVTSQNAFVVISNLTIANGNAAPAVIGHAQNQGGDIFNSGNLTLNNDVIENGHAQGIPVGPDGRGGGIFNAEGSNGIGATLTLNNTIVQNNLARGINGASNSIGTISAPAGQGGNGQGGGIYNDTNAMLIINSGNQIINNNAVGGDGQSGGSATGTGPNGQAALQPTTPGAPGNIGGTGGQTNGGFGTNGGKAQGGGIYSNGTLTIVGTATQQVIIQGDVAQGGLGGNGGNGNNGGTGGAGSNGVAGQNGPNGPSGFNGGTGGKGGHGGLGGHGGDGGNAGNGGAAFGGAIYSDAAGTMMSLAQAVISGDQALGRVGGNGGNGGNGGAGAAAGAGGAGGNGGNATVSGGVGGRGGVGGVGGTGGTGGRGGFGGNAGFGGMAQGGGVFSYTGIVTGINSTTFTNNLAQGGNGGIAGNAGTAGDAGAAGNGGNGGNGGLPKSAGGVGGRGANAGAGGVGGAGGIGGAGGRGADGGAAAGGAIYSHNSNGTSVIGGITQTPFTGNEAHGGTGSGGGAGNQAGAGGVGGTGGGAGAAGSVGLGFPALNGVGGNAGTPGFGGLGGAGGNGGAAQGGCAVFDTIGAGGIVQATITSETALAGDGGNGGNAGKGGTTKAAGKGGTSATNPVTAANGLSTSGGPGGFGGAGGAGGAARGGGIVNIVGALTLGNDSFQQDSATSGAGGNAGNGGDGGDSVGGARTGPPRGGQVGARGGDSGPAAGGAVFYAGGAGTGLTISGTPFASDQVTTKNAGNGGNGGNGGIVLPASPHAPGGTGGRGGDAGATLGKTSVYEANFAGARGGAIATVAGALTISSSSFGTSSSTGNTVTGGAGGNGGQGGNVNLNPAFGMGGDGGLGSAAYGGAISASNTVTNITFGGTQASPILADDNTLTSGNGGNGGPPGGTPGANGGSGGNAGVAYGGSLAIVKETGTANLTSTYSSFASNTVTGGIGGFGLVGGNGGNGGDAIGGGIAAGNTNIQYSIGSLDNNVSTGGLGGKGGDGWGPGGNGGNGGAVKGGGLYSNNFSGTTLTFSFTNGTATSEQLIGGAGGAGGNAGIFGGLNNVPAGSGGAGGNTEGGGLFLLSDNSSVNTNTVSNASFNYNTLTAAPGGRGGAGSSNNILYATTVGAFAAGGQGGASLGGGVYFNSPNPTTFSTLAVTGVTMAGSTLSAGQGGLGGTGTTADGGPGGNGGNAGVVAGGGLCDGSPFGGSDTQLTVMNSTFGGLSLNATNPNTNTLIGANGGRGGDAGTAGHTLPAADGGSGGAGSILEGAGVAVMSGTATFINDTIVANLDTVSLANGAGGQAGGAAGTGTPGSLGNPGQANGGGYFAGGLSSGNSNNPTVNNVGNTIIDLNTAGSSIPLVPPSPPSPPPFVPSSPDVAGTFASMGSNILGTTTGSTGFNAGSGGNDMIANAAQLDLGPLENNGGPTMTDAVLQNSVANATGNVNLVPASLTTDQRGAGFPRINPANNTVDVGAFEFNQPIITSLSPNSAVENSPDLTLTVIGNNFVPGATVTFGTTSLTPGAGSTSSQLIVIVSHTLLTTPGTVQVSVNVPDGSGVPGSTISSTPATFTIIATPFSLINPGTQQNFDGEAVSLPITPAIGFTAGNYTATGLPPGLSIDANTGIISGTISAGADANSPYTVTVTATDPLNNVQASVTFSWQVGPPLSLNNPGNQGNNEGDAVALLITAPNGFTPSGYIVTGLPPGLSINQSTGLISGTINPRGEGTYNVTVTPANNGGQGGVSFQWVVADTTPPSLINPGSQNSEAGQAISLALVYGDADPGSFTATGLPTGLSVNAQGVIAGTIAPNTQGSYAVTIQAADGAVMSAPVSFLWTVSGSVSPPPPPPGGGGPTFTTITNVSNQYPGFVQLETVSVAVTAASGALVNEGVVAIQVDGQTVYAPVVNGAASASVETSLLNFFLWPDLLFPHPLTTVYSDAGGLFLSSSTSLTLPPIYLDFFLFELALQLAPLKQLQV